MINIDEGFAAFEVFKQKFEIYKLEDLSESDTRSKLIDALLIDVLGWNEQDIIREGHVDSGFYDYKISVPGVVFIIEAKRKFKELTLPNYHRKSTLKVLLKQNSEVINQIRSYGIDHGIQFGVITNGYQFILLKIFNTDGSFWQSNSAMTFNGLADIESRFIEFYDNLSKYSIVNSGGFKFDLPINNIESKTVISTVNYRDKELIRNSLSAVLSPLINQVFSEMFSDHGEDDINLVKQCFVDNDETKKNRNEIERLFSDDAPKLANVVPAVNTESISKQIIQEISEDQIAIKNHNPPNPIIIIGSKGAGKTTFINYLFKYRLGTDELNDNYILYIDFRKFYEFNFHFEPEAIATEILESIYIKYEILDLHVLNVLIRIYIKEIRRNDEGIWKYDKENDHATYQRKLADFLEDSQKNKIRHLEYLSKYLIREKRKRFIVVIDNADQFNDTIQEKLFVFAHSLTRSTLCGTVISLREGYYRKWENSPPFDAYESNVYHITAPSYAAVLAKRIDYAIYVNKENPKKTIIQLPGGKNVEITSKYVEDFLDSIKSSLIQISNSALLQFVNETTYPNIREGLRIFKIFLMSGHTKVLEYIDREQKRIASQKNYPVIPLHEFIKSIALQNRHYYNSETSIFINLFIPPIDSTDHFLKIYILVDLFEITENESDSDRYISNETIVAKLTGLDYKLSSIKSALHTLIKLSLIDTDEQLSDIEWKEMPHNLKMSLTMKGHYYLQVCINRLHYHDMIAQDTPIFDPEYFKRLVDIFPTSNAEGIRNFEFRKQFVSLFLDYLEFMESKQPSRVRVVYNNVIGKILNDVRQEITVA